MALSVYNVWKRKLQLVRLISCSLIGSSKGVTVGRYREIGFYNLIGSSKKVTVGEIG